MNQNRPDTRRRRRRDVPDGEDNSEGTEPNKNGNGTNTIVSLPLGNSTLPPMTTTTEGIKIPVHELIINVTNPDEDVFIELKDLDHFEEYRIEVVACNNVGCGKQRDVSVIFGRTVPRRKYFPLIVGKY